MQTKNKQKRTRRATSTVAIRRRDSPSWLTRGGRPGLPRPRAHPRAGRQGAARGDAEEIGYGALGAVSIALAEPTGDAASLVNVAASPTCRFWRQACIPFPSAWTGGAPRP